MTRWCPSSGPDAARRRAGLLQRARSHFSSTDVLAVDTPTLNRYAGCDPGIESMSVRVGGRIEYFLHTSPEFCMKRLLAAGYPDIYSICRVYRDGESGSRHLPEFTMIEWYRLGFGLDEISNDTTALIAQCLDNPGLAADATRLDYRDAFAEFAGIDVLTASVDELATVARADAALRQSVGDDRDAWLDLLLGDVVAPGFRTDGLTVLKHFPASKAALARLCPADPQFSDRFEVFFGEVELANGYVELTDPELQRDRFERELDIRRSAGCNATPWDPLLIGALEAGLPDCAGVAVGVERLQMLHDKAEDIADVVTFTTGRADG